VAAKQPFLKTRFSGAAILKALMPKDNFHDIKQVNDDKSKLSDNNKAIDRHTHDFRTIIN